tara:strand:+ start:30198 stop:30653 length:456 start_codon:yes stop_codon:yes gene_type:complete
MRSKPTHILLVEDDEVDAESMARALRKLNITNPLIHARNGIEALNFLRGTDGHDSIKSPYLVLLDINMPKMNGLEFLEELRKDERHKNAIVFVLTTSEAERDKEQAYRHHIAGYLLKSKAGKNFTDVIKLLQYYWDFVEFPSVIKAKLRSI